MTLRTKSIHLVVVIEDDVDGSTETYTAHGRPMVRDHYDVVPHYEDGVVTQVGIDMDVTLLPVDDGVQLHSIVAEDGGPSSGDLRQYEMPELPSRSQPVYVIPEKGRGL